MRSRTFLCGLLALTVSLAACAPKNLVILVPDLDGTVGQITVSNAGGSVDIDTAHHATAIKDQASAPGTPREIDPGEIEEIFARALAIQPLPPVHFLLYFMPDSTELKAESEKTLSDILAEIARRESKRISIVGHTDTAGALDYNVALSTRRAGSIRNRLVEMGIAAASMEVSSHGESNPLVRTGDNVRNEKNRRVEVVVR